MFLRWLAERGSLSRSRPMHILDADPHNRTLSGYFPNAECPPSSGMDDRRVWLEAEIRKQAKAAERYDVILDIGGGDHLMQRLAYEVRFTETIERVGIDLTAFYLMGPSVSDLDYFQSLEAANFHPKRLALVFNGGLVSGDRSVERAFEAVFNAPLVTKLLDRGAHPIYMPALAPDCLEAVEQSGALTFRDAIPKLDMWHEMRLETWLNQSMEDQVARPLSELGWLA